MAIVVTSPAAATSWRSFHDPDGLFVFDAPGPVQVTRTASNLGGLLGQIVFKQVTYRYSADRARCEPEVMIYDGVKVPPDRMLAVYLSQWRANVALLHIVPEFDGDIELDGVRGHELKFKDPDGFVYDWRLFLLNGRILSFPCNIAPDASSTAAANTAHVAASLHLMP